MNVKLFCQLCDNSLLEHILHKQDRYDFRYTGSVYHNVVHRQITGPERNESGMKSLLLSYELYPNFEVYNFN